MKNELYNDIQILSSRVQINAIDVINYTGKFQHINTNELYNQKQTKWQRSNYVAGINQLLSLFLVVIRPIFTRGGLKPDISR